MNLHFLRFRILDTKGFYRDFFHLLWRARPVIEVRTHGCDFIHHINALDHLAESCILAVKMRRKLMHDEELAAGGVRCHGPCHGENAFFMLQVIFEAVCAELTLDTVTRAAGAGTFRISALNHKTADYAVKNQPVVKALADKGNKIVNGVRCDFRIKFCFENALVVPFL